VKVEREALQLLLTYRDDAVAWAGSLAPGDFTSAARREVFDALMARPDASEAELVQGLSPDALSLFTELTVGAEVLGKDDLDERLREVFTRLQVFSLERSIKLRRTRLQDVDPLKDPQGHDELFAELVGLEAERRDLLKQVQGV
jgi:DNA primase